MTPVDSPHTPSSVAPHCRHRLPLWALVFVGVVAGAVIGLLATKLTDGRTGAPSDRIVLQSDRETTGADHVATVQAFLDAWQRYRDATYTTPVVFERVAKSGQALESSSTYTQQPPRRVVRQAGGMLLTAGSASLTCTTVSNQMVCAPAPATDYETEVAKELAIWRATLLGEVPYYRIAQPEAGCFQLDLAVAIPDPPYGDTARFCFDPPTGALARRQIVRATATDTEEATGISTVIPDDAFAPPTTTR